MALSYGLDPIRYLYADPVETSILHRVLEKAQEMHVERKDHETRALGAEIARVVAKMFK